ncbi:MAG: reverse transcriptase N-terminal domain-containing protein [Pseudomonadota bacterium]
MKDWDWDTIIWKKVRQLVFNLQKRIYKATKAGKYSKAKNLMYLLQNSKCGALYAVRKVTTDNTGKRTPGIDDLKQRKRQKLRLSWLKMCSTRFVGDGISIGQCRLSG